MNLILSPDFFDANFAFSSESSQIKVKNSPLELTLSANHSDNPEGVEIYWYSNCGEDCMGNSNSYFTFTLIVRFCFSVWKYIYN